MVRREGLLVDYGGVLTSDLFASFRAFCELEGLDPETIGRRFRKDRDCRKLLIALETGELEESEFEHGFAAVLGVEEAQLIDRLFAGSQPDLAMLEAVRAARAAGVRTGMVSNSWGTRRCDRDRARAAVRCIDAMRGRGLAALVAIAAAALALASCGSSTLTARQLRMRATAVCTTAVRRSNHIATPRSNAGGAAFLEQGITVFRPEVAALKKLAPPRRLAVAYRAALGDSIQQLDALIATDHNLDHGDDPVVAIKQLDVELAAINTRDRGAWQAVGVATCANLGPSSIRR